MMKMTLISCYRVGMPPWISLQQAHLFTFVNPCANRIQRSAQHHLNSKSIIANCRQYSRRLEKSHPRLFKLHENLRVNDNLSKDWQLIFSPNQDSSNKKIQFSYWFSFLGLCMLPVGSYYGWLESELEERVDLFGIEMSSQTQLILFLSLNAFILSNIYRYFKCIPRRIYYNENTDQYLAIMFHFVPWKVVRKEFKSADIRDYTGFKIVFRFNPLGQNEYKINNRSFIFPVRYFRSGHDRDWMLRHKNFGVKN